MKSLAGRASGLLTAYHFNQVSSLDHCFLVDGIAAEKNKLAAQALCITAPFVPKHAAQGMFSTNFRLSFKLCSRGAQRDRDRCRFLFRSQNNRRDHSVIALRGRVLDQRENNRAIPCAQITLDISFTAAGPVLSKLPTQPR